MSYTPKTWTTGETVTASGLNHIEQGIANAGGVCPLVLIYAKPNGDYEAVGLDFATALAMAQDGTPFMARILIYEASAGWFSSIPDANNLLVYYTEDYPNRIDLQITGGVGFYWTANGIEYYD